MNEITKFRDIMKRDYFKYIEFQSQLDLPFLETYEPDLEHIFIVLTKEFGLLKNSDQKFIDLGSGNGRVVIYVAVNYNINTLGVEINKQLVNEAKEEIKRQKRSSQSKKLFRKLKIQHKDFYELSLQPFDYIYSYTLPTMHRYLKHLFLTAKQGAIVISYKYPLKNLQEFLKLVYKLEIKTNREIVYAYYYQKF